MRSRTKTGLLICGLLLLIIQFIRPEPNKGSPAEHSMYSAPANVRALLKKSCFDCHSNNSNYPWYSNIQPAGWWLSSHIENGKSELNFNELSKYSLRRQKSKLRAIAESIEDGSMPLPSYLWIHRTANLSEPEKQILITWADSARNSLSNISP
jgi:hypothetical protein